MLKSHVATGRTTAVVGVVRFLQVCLILTARLAVLAVIAVRCSFPSAGNRFAPRRDAWLLATVTTLGPVFVKVAQILSTRADVVPRHTIQLLSTLHDQVRPVPLGASLRHFAPELRRSLRDVRDLATLAPFAAGTIACVYRAELTDGSAVALKVRRPGIAALLSADLAVMVGIARLAAVLPPLRGVPVVDLMRQLAASLRGQLDFHNERKNLRLLRRNLADEPDVRVPAVYDRLCGPEVLVMEYLHDLHPSRPAAAADAQAAVTALRAAYRMLFLDGLVHCDLHPGNLVCGPGRAVTIVDAGFTVRLTPHAKEKFTDFFDAMSHADGQACADIVLSTARAAPRTDTAAFRRDFTAFVEGDGHATAAEFDLMTFTTRLFALQRRHGLYADPQFVFPILSLLVLEGTVRELSPHLDFQAVAHPYLTIALMERAIASASRKQQESG